MNGRADYSRQAAGEALGARLRRLAERIDGEVARIYAGRGIAFEQRWYGVLHQIVLNGPITIGDVAGALRITHASVSQASSSLERAGYIRATADPGDGRRRLLQLTRQGERMVSDLAPLWNALGAVAAALNAEAGNVVGLLDRLDDALDAHSLFERVSEHLSSLAQANLRPSEGNEAPRPGEEASWTGRARASGCAESGGDRDVAVPARLLDTDGRRRARPER